MRMPSERYAEKKLKNQYDRYSKGYRNTEEDPEGYVEGCPDS